MLYTNVTQATTEECLSWNSHYYSYGDKTEFTIKAWLNTYIFTQILLLPCMFYSFACQANYYSLNLILFCTWPSYRLQHRSRLICIFNQCFMQSFYKKGRIFFLKKTLFTRPICHQIVLLKISWSHLTIFPSFFQLW